MTLHLWLAVPLSYPCWAKSLTQEERIEELRLLAVAAGGNLVIASPSGRGAIGVILRASPEYLDKLGHNKTPAPRVPPPEGVKTL